MTERLANVAARIESVRQLGAVVNAMTGIAAARARAARGQLGAVDLYAETIAQAMAHVLAAVAREPDPPPAGQRTLLLFCAEQGFAGAFSERILDSVAADAATADLFLIGSRARSVAAQRGVTPAWTAAAPSHSPAIPKFADGLLQTLYPFIESGRIGQLEAVFATWTSGVAKVERRRLLPVVEADLPPIAGRMPLTNLDYVDLLPALGANYLHAQLCSVALHAFAAENEARMAAMSAARSQIERELATDQAIERRVRQEATTAEIIELATGEIASVRRNK